MRRKPVVVATLAVVTAGVGLALSSRWVVHYLRVETWRICRSRLRLMLEKHDDAPALARSIRLLESYIANLRMAGADAPDDPLSELLLQQAHYILDGPPQGSAEHRRVWLQQQCGMFSGMLISAGAKDGADQVSE